MMNIYEVQEIKFIIPVFTVGIAAKIATFTVASLGLAGTSSEVPANQSNSIRSAVCSKYSVGCNKLFIIANHIRRPKSEIIPLE
jgi:hypothetical protein